MLDAGTDAFGKASLFGKYSSPIALGAAGISIFADSQSESTSGEFAANTIQTTIETSVGLKSPALSIGLHINFQDAKAQDGLTNLSNGRMSNAYSSSQKQIQSYLKKNFYNKSTTNNGNSYKGGNKFDYALYYMFTFQWGKLDDIKEHSRNHVEQQKKNNNE